MFKGLEAKLLSAFLSLQLVLLLSLPDTLAALAEDATQLEKRYDVAKVQFVGNRRIDSEALRQQLDNSSGSISAAEITESIKKIYRTGFFDQVSAEILTASDNARKQVLQYRVVEKPIVRKVFITGNDEVGEDDLSEIFSFSAERFLDRAKIAQLIRKTKTFYQSKGYYDAEFDYSVVPVGDNQVDLTLKVVEGKRYKIDEISFEGLKVLDEDELLDKIQTTRYKWWSSWLFGTGRVNPEMLENDKILIKQYLFTKGLIDSTVSDALVEKRDGELYVRFTIEEGPQYRIGDVTASGDLIDDSSKATLADIKTSTGEIFDASKLRADSFTISNKFSDIGYAFVNVVPDTMVNRSMNEVNIDFRVDKGKPVDVRRIKITGNEKTYDRVIRRELKIAEQERYSGSKVERSRVLLERLGYFDEVSISSEPTGKDDEVDLNVNVREGSTGSFSIGAGYSSSDGAIFNSRLSENNIFGTGRQVVINADLGDERENLILSLNDRRFNDSYVSLGADALRTRREFTDFDRKLVGGSLTAGYPLEYVFGEWAQDIAFSLKYEYLDITISDVNPDDAAQLVIDSEGSSSASGLTPRLIRNTINNPLNPTEGSQQSISFEVTGPGGNEEYYLLDARNTIYYPLLETDYGKLVFSWRTKFGYGSTFDDDTFPLFRRFFPGGINSVRGFESRTLGPKDENGNEYGGSKQFVNNFEIIFPILNSAGLKGVVFYDIGQAFDDNQSIKWDLLREAYGYGIRWNSPLGPIRIEFGFPIDKETGEDSMVTLFSFGAPL
jgi:outer membrane protein insertion porin family